MTVDYKKQQDAYQTIAGLLAEIEVLLEKATDTAKEANVPFVFGNRRFDGQYWADDNWYSSDQNC